MEAKIEKSSNILSNGSKLETLITIPIGNIKEYKEDGSFIITKNDLKFISGTYFSKNHQIIENTIDAKVTAFERITNTLPYKLEKRRKILMVKYQLPNPTSII